MFPSEMFRYTIFLTYPPLLAEVLMCSPCSDGPMTTTSSIKTSSTPPETSDPIEMPRPARWVFPRTCRKRKGREREERRESGGRMQKRKRKSKRGDREKMRWERKMLAEGRKRERTCTWR